MKRSAPDLIQTTGSLDGLRTTACAGSTTPLMRSDDCATTVTGWPMASGSAAPGAPAHGKGQWQHAVAQRTRRAQQPQRASGRPSSAAPATRPAAVGSAVVASTSMPRRVHDLEEHVARLDHLTQHEVGCAR
jgi:hypothetical protein